MHSPYLRVALTFRAFQGVKYLFMDLEDAFTTPPAKIPAMSEGLQVVGSAGAEVGTPNAPRRSPRFQANRALAEDDIATPRPGRFFNRTAIEGDTS